VTQRPPVAYPISPTGARRAPIPYRTATLVPRYNAVGRWSLTTRLTEAVLPLLSGGWRIAWDGAPEPDYGGHVDYVRLEISTGSDGKRLLLVTLSGPDNMAVLAERLAYPDPTQPVTNQAAQAYDVRSAAKASTVILQYTQRNAGHLAISGRPTPNFNSNITDPLIGPSAKGKARFDPLLDLVGSIATTAGLRIAVPSTTLGARTLAITPCVDRTASARFSIALRTLKGLTYELRAPTGTYVVAGGRGEEDSRDFRAANNAAAASAWRRVETFTDARTSAAAGTDGGAELQAAADQRLAETGPAETVDLVPLETSRLRYGVDYQLGDTVTGEVGMGTGLSVAATVQEVEITIGRAPGRPLVRVEPRASTLAVRGRLATDRALLDLIARVSRLERAQ